MTFETPPLVDAAVGIVWAVFLLVTLLKAGDIAKSKWFWPLVIAWVITGLLNLTGVVPMLPAINWLCLAYVVASIIAIVVLAQARKNA